MIFGGMGELVQGRFSLLPVLRFPALFKWMPYTMTLSVKDYLTKGRKD
jgi:hypothetical protein